MTDRLEAWLERHLSAALDWVSRHGLLVILAALLLTFLVLLLT